LPARRTSPSFVYIRDIMYFIDHLKKTF